ncbi:MAG: hypothetical protein HY260_14685 [Chloroflexi bacterium]|nr:hypothetical protein [Chloroflexota bacterium]
MKTPTPTIAVNPKELARVLEPLIRRIVREELTRAVTQRTKILRLKPDSPLYDDLREILRRKAEGRIKLYSYAEVWSE